jgi:alpha/beta superfamily hydrolase
VPEAPVALILHPHPEHGGTMNNKVVYTLYQACAEEGFHVVRFNFRGVGKSTGHFDFGEGELRDGIYVLNWIKESFPKASELWIIGFSFGSWVALQLMKKNPEIKHFICAGVPANVYDFSFVLPFDREGIFIQGTADTIVDPMSVQKLSDKVSRMSSIPIDCFMIEEADHFFTGKLEQLTQITKNYIQKKRGLL